MKIIDSNKDFYDFYQNVYRDDTFTFDRRDSYNLSKSEFAKHFRNDPVSKYWRSFKSDKHDNVLLQVHNTFWLFSVTILKADDSGFCTDYDLKLLATWKDYNHKNELIKLSHIDFKYYVKDDADKKIEAVKRNDYDTIYIWNHFTISKSKGVSWEQGEKHIPILQYIGIASQVNPLDIYLSLEEYFAKQKTDTERIESVGLTNNEKITNHGFDLKNSFRGTNT